MIRRQRTSNTFTLIIMINIFSSCQLLNALQQPIQPCIQLPEEDDSHLTTPEARADFTRTSHDAAHQDITTPQLLSMHSNTDFSELLHIDQDIQNDMAPLCRGFNNAFIKVNPDGNVDMRMTGSTTLLGKVSLPYTQKNFFTGNPIIIGSDGVIGIGNVDFPGDVTISGTLITNNIALGNPVVFGNTHIFGQKTLAPIPVLPSTTTALTLNFTNPTGTTGPLFKGANVKLYCFIAGSVLGLPSLFLYTAEIYVAPGTNAGATPPAIISLTQVTTLIQGSVLPATVTATTSGLGTNVVISFSTLLGMTNQSVTLFYEILSDNLTSAS